MRVDKRNVLIIDSNKEKVRKISSLLRMVYEDVQIYAVDNVADAYEKLMQTTIDVFILDVIVNNGKCGDVSGLRLVERIREISSYMFTPVIFVTCESESELYAFQKLHCTGYVKEPYDIQEMQDLLRYALHFRTSRSDKRTLVFRNKNMLYPIMVKEIVYIETIDHTMDIHLNDGTIVNVPYKTYKNLLAEADTDYLMQCSRNTVLNKRYIFGVDVSNRSIVMRKGYGVKKIGSTYKEKVMAELGLKK